MRLSNYCGALVLLFIQYLNLSAHAANQVASTLESPVLQKREVAPGTRLPPVLNRQSNQLPLYADELFVLRRVKYFGNKKVSDKELNILASECLNRKNRMSDIYLLRDQITKTYIEKGYLNSGAILPSQIVEAGTVQIDIV